MIIGNNGPNGHHSRKSPPFTSQETGHPVEYQDEPHLEDRGAGTDCIFCQWRDPSLNTILYENASFYVRYDNFPANPGHVEIVPKRHVESFFDLDDKEAACAHRAIHKAKALLDEQYFPEAYTIGINDGKAAGQSIDHLHIHLIPRHQGDVDDARGGIRKAAPNCDPDNWR